VIDTAGIEAEPVPSNMPIQLQDVVSGVRPLADSILLVLDADRAVDVSTVPDTSGGKP
jgi:purine-binding chemotaxis protein CheW